MAEAEQSREGIPRQTMERLMFGSGTVRRFTQDSPVLPDVWLEFAKTRDERATPHESAENMERFPPARVLLTPFRNVAPGELAAELRKRLQTERKEKGWLRFEHDPKSAARIIYNQTTVAATLYFEDLVRAVMPMTDWWRGLIDDGWQLSDLEKRRLELAEDLIDPEHASQEKRVERTGQPLPADVPWLIRVAGALAIVRLKGALPSPFDDPRKISAAKADDWVQFVDAVVEAIRGAGPYDGKALIYSVSLNRDAAPTIAKSTLAIKADAARRLFDISCSKVRWAVIDTGIDARHAAFRTRGKNGQADTKAFESDDGKAVNNTRVLATYDFTELDVLLDPDNEQLPSRIAGQKDVLARIKELNKGLLSGRSIDWSLIEPLIRIPHEEATYVKPPHEHGTHVAGILGANWRTDDATPPRKGEGDMVGVCPDIVLYDMRVLDGKGRGDEFSVMAALQFIRYLNAKNDYISVHGANLSLSIPHDIANYACGRTPVCEECERVVSSGVVVVAAAGNQGYRKYTTEDGVTTEAYNSMSITDPGNADLVITVGATHRAKPHTYGVSYFSSRGPTGDGRIKPDLVAPGEKITAPLPNDAYGLKDGTSMAAPHVSGAAALLMARHLELVGRPQQVKQILCSTATDLGRERYFQGAGMLDVLRALQAV